MINKIYQIKMINLINKIYKINKIYQIKMINLINKIYKINLINLTN